MKHPSTQAVFDYWNARRGTRPAPERGDIDPTAIRHALGDTFMLAADFVDQLRFRLAGTRVCALFCREIKGETFAALWNEQSRDLIEELLGIVTSENVGAVAGLRGAHRRRRRVELELLLLPLAHSGPCPHPRARRAGADAAALLAGRQAGDRARARHPAPYRAGVEDRDAPALRAPRCRTAAGCGMASWSTAAGAKRRRTSAPANAALMLAP